MGELTKCGEIINYTFQVSLCNCVDSYIYEGVEHIACIKNKGKFLIPLFIEELEIQVFDKMPQ